MQVKLMADGKPNIEFTIDSKDYDNAAQFILHDNKFYRRAWYGSGEAAFKQAKVHTLADFGIDTIQCVVDATLNAANEYITKQYGISAIGNPIDRERIIGLMTEKE